MTLKSKRDKSLNNTIQVLPKITSMPDRPTVSRHFPPPGTAYERFFLCLRWDFGFSCAFCLLHEADFSRIPGDRLGLFWVEHIFRRKFFPELTNDYENCAYSCRLCNMARGQKPEKKIDGAELLNPRNHSWSNYFTLNKDEVVEIDFKATPSSSYTFDAYDLGDPRKTELRRQRRETIDHCLFIIEKFPKMISSCIGEGDLENAEIFLRILKSARGILDGYKAVPADIEEACACSIKAGLPDWLNIQLLNIEFNY